MPNEARRGKPDMKSILDPSFRYVPSGQTDLRKTFARVRRELRLAAAPSGAGASSRAPQVVPLGLRKHGPAA